MERSDNEFDRDFENDSQLILGLDVGLARCGIARSDPGGTLASPLTVVKTQPEDTLAQRIAEAVSGNVEVIAIGLPLDHHGGETEMCEFARSVGKSLRSELACEIAFVDERFTTVAAQRGRDTVKGKGRPPADIDAWAAAEILQTYLEQRKNST